MDEMQLNEILASYRDAINALIERADAQDGMIQAVREKAEGTERLIFDEVINPAKAEMEKQIYNAGLEDFTNKYGEKLNGYNDKLRPIEGEDFDIMKQAYDGYNSIEGEKPDEAEYIDELVKVVDKQLDDIRAAIGAPANAEVEVKQDENGETSVEVDGQEIKEVSEDSEDSDKTEVKETEETEETEIKDSDEESDPEELAALEEELLKYAK
jgi:hypothetical protein